MIGLFDSGVGGLTVVKELERISPDAPFLYLGDTARTPYGNKGAGVIQTYSEENTRFLLQHGATAIVIACNSASAVALDHLKTTFPETPIFDVIRPAVDAVTSEPAIKTVGIIGTRATIGSKVYQDLIHYSRPDIRVVAEACPLLVPLAEEGWQGKPETTRIVRKYLKPMRDAQIDALILGCTHYPLLMKEIRASVHKRVKIIDSPSAVMHTLQQQHPKLIETDSSRAPQFYFTDCSEHTAQIAQKWLGHGVSCQLANMNQKTA